MKSNYIQHYDIIGLQNQSATLYSEHNLLRETTNRLLAINCEFIEIANQKAETLVISRFRRLLLIYFQYHVCRD